MTNKKSLLSAFCIWDLLRLWTSDRFELLDIQEFITVIIITINSHLKWG